MAKILVDTSATETKSSDPMATYRQLIAGTTETSKIIRKLRAAIGDHEKPVAKIEQLLKQLGVTTKAGEPIRYQHVRNVLTQSLGSVK